MSHHQYKLALLSRLRELGVRLHGIEDALEQPHSKDWDEMAIEREGDEVLEKLGLDGEAEIMRIKAALGRIAKGEYGICQICGGDISDDRLNVVPDTPFCRSCASGRSAH